jgi:stage II sporulation protein D
MDVFEKPMISVGIMAAKRTVHIRLTGTFRMDRGVTLPPGEYTVRADKDRVFISNLGGENFVAQRSLALIPGSSQESRVVLRRVPVGTGFHWQQYQDRTFEGHLEIQPIGGVNLQVINRLPLETYLCSVVGSEMSENAPPEFLKAHAVISRSWAMRRIGAKISPCSPAGASTDQTDHDTILRWSGTQVHDGFDVCAEDHCQRYRGFQGEAASNPTRAVQNTQGEVLMYGDRICDTRYSKCCGGMTENFAAAWEDKEIPYLRGLPDNDQPPSPSCLPLSVESNARAWITGSPEAYCNVEDRDLLGSILPSLDSRTVDFFRWQTGYSQEELGQTIVQKTGRDLGQILDLVPLQRGASGRIIRLRIVGTMKSLTVGKELEIRRVLSPTHLYSSAFVVFKEPGTKNIPKAFRFVGAGWGHGVGLCQIGAAILALHGKTYRGILHHYFPRTDLRARYGKLDTDLTEGKK